MSPKAGTQHTVKEEKNTSYRLEWKLDHEAITDQGSAL